MDPKKPSQDDLPHYRTEPKNQKGKNKRSYEDFTAFNAAPPPAFHFTPPPLTLGFLPTSPADMNAGQGQLGQFPQPLGSRPGPIAFPPPLSIFSPIAPGPQTTATDEPELTEPNAKRVEKEGSASFTPMASTTAEHMQQDNYLGASTLGSEQANDGTAQQLAEEEEWGATYAASSGQGGYATRGNWQDAYMNDVLHGGYAADAWLVDPLPNDLSSGNTNTNEQGANSNAWQGGFESAAWQDDFESIAWQNGFESIAWQNGFENTARQGGHVEDEEKKENGEHEQQEEKEPLNREQPAREEEADEEEEQGEEEGEEEQARKGDEEDEDENEEEQAREEDEDEDEQQASEEEEEEDEDEEEDATKELQIIKFAELEGVQVLTEKFEHDGEDRRRPVEWKIPFAQWQQPKLASSAGATPRPMSLYGEPYTKTDKSKTQWVDHDEDFDADKKYQYGHMLPTASGASQHYALTTPMEQRTNQVHGWKEAEGKINRLLLKPGSKDTSATPADKEEEDLALLIQRSHSDGENGRDGFVRIVAHYEDDDERVPSSYHVRLYGRADDEVHLLYEFEEINNSSDVDRDVKPSAGLIALFATMNERMQVLDEETAKEAEQGRRHASDTQWTPIKPVASSVMGASRRETKEAYFPGRGIPEQHLPRPHRVLDVLVAELAKNPKPYKKQLAALTEEEQAEINEVLQVATGPSRGFSRAQLSLAERHARAEGKGRFLSDVRPEIADSITKPGNSPKQNAKLQRTYRDQVEELQHGQGNIRPEGDHHVPQKTGAGTNHFTNLLWMSRAKNNSPESKNKSADVTNPNRSRAAMDIGLQFGSESSSSSVRVKSNTQKLTTVTKGELGPEDTTREHWLHSLFDGAEDSPATRAKLYDAEELERRQQEAYQAHLAEYELDEEEEMEKWEAANKGVRPMPWKIDKQSRQDAKKLFYH